MNIAHLEATVWDKNISYNADLWFWNDMSGASFVVTKKVRLLMIELYMYNTYEALHKIYCEIPEPLLPAIKPIILCCPSRSQVTMTPTDTPLQVHGFTLIMFKYRVTINDYFVFKTQTVWKRMNHL
jgi:hypothetical protein